MSLSRKNFLLSAYRSFSRVMNAGGELVIRPMQALNLPVDRDLSIYTKVSYGDEWRQTRSCLGSSNPFWSDEDGNEMTFEVRT